MAKCENCGTHIKQKLAQSHGSDGFYDVTYFPEEEPGGPLRSVPRNYYCSVECVVSGVQEEQPKGATEESHERRKELISDD